MASRRYLFVTGKLAEPALRRTLASLGPDVGFEAAVAVLPISVAALATTTWIGSHLTVPEDVDRVVLPGLCRGDMHLLQQQHDRPFERGPADLRDLPEFFGKASHTAPDYGAHDIEILAELNNAPRLTLAEIMSQAGCYRDSGADIIDLGCEPGQSWAEVGTAVRALRADGMRVSVDSFDPLEVSRAVEAGAELVLSVNHSNLSACRSWGCEVVAIPDTPSSLDGLDRTVETLREWEVPFRIDPVIEPIGFGFAASLGRYLEVRRRFPEAEMMMGIGNITELTDADSAGINVLLLGFCQEIGIRSVLTTEVINWCRSAVRELDLARRLVYYACKHKMLPKRLEPDLVLLRDPKLREHGDEALAELAASVTDPNFRVFAELGAIQIFNNRVNLKGADPFELFKQVCGSEDVSASHAFYLGFEMAKAVVALNLGKNYTQDQALRWGFLTVPEKASARTCRPTSRDSVEDA
jgi:dihydropteroate synthase-like protein